MKNVLDTLRERGFVKQTVFGDELYELLGSKSVTFYNGYDPTADSLTAGHFVTLMAMAHLQRAGHRPIILIGGGTAMVGDPSGRSDMRTMMSKETIAHNVECFKRQMARFIDVDKAIFVNNADWLGELNYIDFLREIGVCFSVNQMLTAECFKQRLEKGLSFLEFNYMLMQGYDFLVLNRKYDCVLQTGGDDQWSNMLAGADLIRRKEGKKAYALTYTLLTTSDGKKMGKTAKGALWLDPNKTSPYEFYQYWRNVEDEKVEECLKLLTFVELDEIKALCAHKDERINEAKKRLAYEVTALVHGKEAAEKAQAEALGAFGHGSEMPTLTLGVSPETLVVDLLVEAKLTSSKSEARRVIEGGGVSIDETKITGIAVKIGDVTSEKQFVLHKGKKSHIKIILA